MRNNKTLIVMASIFLSSVISETAFALTFDYSSSAQALAEVGWYDYFGLVADADFDIKEAANARSEAAAYYDKIQFMGHVGISASAEALIEPNEVISTTEVTGSYEFDIGWELMEYFYQDANSIMEGWLLIDEFPAGAPCRLQIDISFPNETWDGLWAWQLYIESSSEYFVAGRDELGDYGKHSGIIDACAGEEIYVFLAIAAGGYADHYTETLGYGKLTINTTLKALPHIADLTADGGVDFKDFAVFSSHWLEHDCEDPNTNWCGRADIDQSGAVDANDLEWFTEYWLLFPDPNQIPLQQELMIIPHDKSERLSHGQNFPPESRNPRLSVNLPSANIFGFSRNHISSLNKIRYLSPVF